METLERLDKAAAASLGVVNGIQADMCGNATPCSEWDVQALMNHMIGSMSFFVARAKGVEPSQQQVSTTNCEDAVRQLSNGIKTAVEAWRAPGALDRKVQAPMGEVPADFLANITTTEMLMHGWDLARATGQSYKPDEALVEDALGVVRTFLTPDRRGQSFGAEKQPPANAPAIDRLAAFTGRQP